MDSEYTHIRGGDRNILPIYQNRYGRAALAIVLAVWPEAVRRMAANGSGGAAWIFPFGNQYPLLPR
jgi:hypothetical protein